MDVSLNPATKQELEAKLQELKQEIESIALKQEGMEKRGSDTCFRKLHEIAVELRREGLSLEEKKKLSAEHAKLDKDPLFAEWARLRRHQMKLLRQSFVIEDDLKKMNAAEAQPSAGQPSEASSPAALGPPARPAAQTGFMTSADSGIISILTALGVKAWWQQHFTKSEKVKIS